MPPEVQVGQLQHKSSRAALVVQIASWIISLKGQPLTAMRTFPTGLIAALIATVGVAVADNAGVTSQRLTLNPIRLAAGGAPGGAASLGAAADAATGRASQPERYSGYFKLNHTSDAHMFFFLFEAREDPDNAPVVLWMTGAPAAFQEYPPLAQLEILLPLLQPPWADLILFSVLCRRSGVLLRAGRVLRKRAVEHQRRPVAARDRVRVGPRRAHDFC